MKKRMNMKKTTIRLSALLAIATACVARAASDEIPKPEGMEFGEYLFLLGEGGYAEKPNSGQGEVLLVNLQDRVAADELVKAGEGIRKDVNVKITVERAERTAQMTIRIVDESGNMEPLSVYPDSIRATVNVAPLARDNPPPDILAARVRKEVMRAFAFLGGAAGGDEGLLMDAMTKLDRLDKAEERLPGDIVLKCDPYLRRIGMKKWTRVTYRQACREGWANEPSNEFEKAVWDEVRAIPQKPMRIIFDPKKGR